MGLAKGQVGGCRLMVSLGSRSECSPLCNLVSKFGADF